MVEEKGLSSANLIDQPRESCHYVLNNGITDGFQRATGVWLQTTFMSLFMSSKELNRASREFRVEFYHYAEELVTKMLLTSVLPADY